MQRISSKIRTMHLLRGKTIKLTGDITTSKFHRFINMLSFRKLGDHFCHIVAPYIRSLRNAVLGDPFGRISVLEIALKGQQVENDLLPHGQKRLPIGPVHDRS